MSIPHHEFQEQMALQNRFLKQVRGEDARTWSDGRTGPLDDGDLTYAMANDDKHGVIRMRFPKAVTELGLDLKAATELRDQLTERIMALRGVAVGVVLLLLCAIARAETILPPPLPDLPAAVALEVPTLAPARSHCGPECRNPTCNNWCIHPDCDCPRREVKSVLVAGDQQANVPGSNAGKHGNSSQYQVVIKQAGHWEVRGCETGTCRRVWVPDQPAAKGKAYVPVRKSGVLGRLFGR